MSPFFICLDINMITVENLTKSFGDRILFKNVSFRINPRERVGLVGRNGHGKTTLFRIIVDEEGYDAGRVRIPKNYRIGYVRQQLRFTQDSVLKEGMQVLPPHEQGHHWKVEKILAGLGFSQEDMQNPPRQLSGGFQVRLNLAKILISEPDLLLLDEPTNYLDITAIRWVGRFLVNWPHELILITHDRDFMDKIATHTMGIHRCKVRKLPGDTAKFYAQMARDEEIYEKTRVRDERRRKEIQRFIDQFRAKARLTNLVQSRVKTLAKTVPKEKLETISTLEFAFREKPFKGKFVLRAESINFGYIPKLPLIRNFNLAVRAGDRICIIGKNGKGKTTLLRLLAGSLKQQSGKTEYHQAIAKGVFEQTNLQQLRDENTVEGEILYSNPDVGRQAARDICGAMLFEGDDALKKVTVLSGGEKSRVMLGKILVTPANLLLLDEPTNHLDMDACDALLAAIDSFAGTMILVTHNEMFLHALAQRLIVFQNDHIEVFEGSYQRFLESGGWQDEDLKSGRRPGRSKDSPIESRISKKELKRMRAKILNERSRVLKPLEERLERVEDEIEALEKELSVLNQSMLEASKAQNGTRIGEFGKAIHSIQTEIERRFAELEKVTLAIERQWAVFDEKFEAIPQNQA